MVVQMHDLFLETCFCDSNLPYKYGKILAFRTLDMGFRIAGVDDIHLALLLLLLAWHQALDALIAMNVDDAQP